MIRVLTAGYKWYAFSWLICVLLLAGVLSAWRYQQRQAFATASAGLARYQQVLWRDTVRALAEGDGARLVSRYVLDHTGRIRSAEPSWLVGTERGDQPEFAAGQELSASGSALVLAADPVDDLNRPTVVYRRRDGLVVGTLEPTDLLPENTGYTLVLRDRNGTVIAATGSAPESVFALHDAKRLAGTDLILEVGDGGGLFRSILFLAALGAGAVILALLLPLLRMRREKRLLQEERGFVNRLIARLVTASSDRTGVLIDDIGTLQAASSNFLHQINDRRLHYRENEHQLQLTINLIASISTLIDQIKQHTDLLATSHDHLQAIIDALDEAVLTVDREHRLQTVNSAAERLLGTERLQVQDRLLHEVIPTEDQHGERLARLCRRTIERDRSGSLREPLPCLDVDGEVHQLIASCSPLMVSHDVSGAVVTLRDITEQHHLQAQLQHSLKVDTIGRLAAGIAHDFKNILTSILMSAERLSDDLEDRPGQRRRAETIVAAADKAARLTQQLMNYVRQQEPEPRPNDVHELIDESLAILQENCGPRIDIDTRCRAINSTVLCDQGQMVNALVNFGINSRDAMPDGGQLVFSTRNLPGRISDDRVGTGIFSETGLVEIEISDTGCGISPASLEHIFEPFFTTKQHGTGLGLSTLRDLFRSYSGEVTVESTEGEGTVFRVVLPTTRTRTEKKGQSSWHSVVGGEGCLLIADDEISIREILTDTCEGYGFSVITAEDGLQTVDCYREHQTDIDLVLLDIHMPKQDGIEVFRRIRQIDSAAQVILCSGYADSENIRHLLEHEGLAGHLIKPYTTRMILKAIHKALGNKSQER